MPGAGPAFEGDSWNVARHPKHVRRQKPYLTDNVELGRAFRKHYLHGLQRLISKGQIQLGGSVAFLIDLDQRDAWLDQLKSIDWNVFIEGPPNGKSAPENVVKYLASYLTGGPISDRRIIRANDEEVCFWARPKKKSTSSSSHRGMNKSAPYRLSGFQFLQRWTLHILPKGFTRSRCYGGYHGRKREDYLHRCRELLEISPEEVSTQQVEPDEDSDSSHERTCPRCESTMELIQAEHRPSWSEIFERKVYASDVNYPQHYIGLGRSPPVKEDET